jgi:hypothetical protein
MKTTECEKNIEKFGPFFFSKIEKKAGLTGLPALFRALRGALLGGQPLGIPSRFAAIQK